MTQSRFAPAIRWVAISASALVFIPATGWFVRQMIYPAPPFTVPSPPPLPLKEVTLSVSSGQSVNAWLLEAQDSSSLTPVIVYFHGNGENLQTMQLAGLFDQFQNLNAHFLAVDYPGYGRSEGNPSESRNLEAADAAIQWVQKKYPQNQLIVCGWSLGAAVAAQTAARHADTISRLILMSPWSSLSDVAVEHFPRWLVKLILHEKYDSVKSTAAIRCPVLVIHGEADTIIPVWHGKKLAEAFGSKAQFVMLPRTGHNDLLSRPEVWTALDAFITPSPEK